MPRIEIYTKKECPYCQKAKELLREKGQEYTEINVEESPERLQEMLARSKGRKTVPEIFIDGELIGGFDDLRDLANSGKLDPLLGLKAKPTEIRTRLVIVGSGSAGLTAAIYAARAGLKPIVVEGRDPGGQLFTTTLVENYPGFPDGVQGPELMQRTRAQAEKFGTQFITAEAVSVDLSRRPFFIELSDCCNLRADALIIATGASPRELSAKGERELRGYGVSTCATCDGPFFKDREVAVVGGGDSALEEALSVSKFASRVTVIHRRDKFRASQIMQERAFKNEKIGFLWNTEVKEIYGSHEKGVTGIRIVDRKSLEEKDLFCQGVFVAIGHEPNTSIFKGQLEMDERGYMVSKEFPQTSVRGVFVAGDAFDHRFRQAVTAAGDGCKAALAAEHYLAGLAS
ncbi:MAG: thioredoxin-disulfide reductase [Candidatus Tectomicrobia bacterium]|uniref:Thioredoxin reductase n=1 Tax=Tectimicrobiota bacterium TaxID=2528274 RepID=A0A932GM60_UNCTE|nr:thioredoxin-disulfide reductase [Candidatus Tectomicrobia bacterium]